MTLNLFDRIRTHSKEIPGRTAFRSLSSRGIEEITYSQIRGEIQAISLSLQRRGVQAGDAVGILMENHPRWGVAFLAGQSAGAVIVPLDILHSAETLASLIAFAECRFLFCSQELLPLLEEVQQHLPARLPGIVIGATSDGYGNWEAIVEKHGREDVTLPLVEKDPESPHVIMYTSGTTGNPKGVVLTGRNIYQNVVEVLKLIPVGPEDNFLNVLPLYHILALMVNFIAPLYCGSRVTFLDVLDARKIMKTFKDEGISIFVCVPQFYNLLQRRIFQEIDQLAFPKKILFRTLYALARLVGRHSNFKIGRLLFPAIHKPFGDRLRILAVGGARFAPEVATSLHYLGFKLIQAYGMTETAALVTVAHEGWKDIGTVGKALPHCEVTINDPDEGGNGEVLIRGANVMKGYLKNPEATCQAMDSEGWLHSGDLGRLSQEGFLTITGRVKDIIVLSSGKNIYPEEIEHFYQSHCPFIKEMCVLGISEDEQSVQETLHAVVVPDFDRFKQQQIVNAYEMLRYLMENLGQKLPPHKRIRSFEIRRHALPRTTTRKIMRHEVKAELSAAGRTTKESRAEPEQVWEATSEIERIVVEVIRRIKEDSQPRPESNLELDLGFESLDRVEFVSNLQEKLEVGINDDEATELFTVQDVIHLLEKKLDQGIPGGSEVRKSWSDILSEPLSPEDRTSLESRLRRRFFVELLFVTAARIALVLGKILFRLKAEDLHKLPTRYPFMLCPNHLSFVDTFVLVALLPSRVIRRFFALGYASYFSEGLVGFLGRLTKTVPVDADRNLRKALRLAAEGLRSDLVLCVFPEGERSIDGTLKDFKKGPAILSTELKIPVVPVGIRGSYEVWRRGASKIRFRPITIRFGDVLEPAEGETIDSFNQRLRSAVEALV